MMQPPSMQSQPQGKQLAHESLAEKAVSTVAAIEDLKKMLADVDDYCEPTGFCQEYQDLAEDAYAFLGTLRRRAFTLKRRFERTQSSRA